MKVALATFVYEPELGGGAAQVVQSLAHHLVTQGIDVIVITTHNERRITVTRTPGLTVLRFFPWNLYWVAHKDRQPRWKRVLWQLIDIWNPYTYFVVRQILEQVEPEVVHVHKMRGLSPALWNSAKAAGVTKTVQTCHDYELISPEGTLSGRLGLLAQQGRGPLVPYQRLRRYWSRAVTTVTAPSRYTLSMITDLGFFSTATQSVIPNSHGLTMQQLEARRIAEKLQARPYAEIINILYLGRLESSKGVDILCAAFATLVARYPHARLHLAGWGTMGEALRLQYRHTPQIILHGAVFGDKKQQLLTECDCMVVPSVWAEVFGIVITEAFANGKPVITSAIGGIPELIEAGVTGWLVPPDDQEALSEVLARVIEQPDALQQMATACFAAAQRYTADGVANQYLDLYHQVVQHG